MLNQEFTDYNNLVDQLILEKKDPKTGALPKPSSTKEKLIILDAVVGELTNAMKQKRTDFNSFPFYNVARFSTQNLTNSKMELRQISRLITINLYKLFGFEKMETHLRKLDEKELSKLKDDIRELKSNPDSDTDNSRSLININISNTTPKKNTNVCATCQKGYSRDDDLKTHQKNECVMYANCFKCLLPVEIKNYAYHLTNICLYKNEFNTCKTCKEPIESIVYDKHTAENKCLPFKNLSLANRCLLCHKDIYPGDKGWFKHLAKDGCPNNKRKSRYDSNPSSRNSPEKNIPKQEASKENKTIEKKTKTKEEKGDVSSKKEVKGEVTSKKEEKKASKKAK